MFEIPQRQIHLDFHTPGDVEGVGANFDGAEFAATLKAAHVQSVNLFAKCHHGYSYYPTSVGTPHPGLERDLLGEQIDALHRVGIRAPIYLAVGWDDLAGEQHPEWMIVNRDGGLLMRPPLTDHSPLQNQVGWSWMDVASEYSEYVNMQVEELCDRYDVDGFWFDIVLDVPNYSPSAQARMRRAGVDMSDEKQARGFAAANTVEFITATSARLRARRPTASIYYNGTTTATASRTLEHQTQLEVESLPTGSEAHWGYLHYPIAARFARSLDIPIVGMTGRFHKSWADFGGLKTRAQLEYECGTIVAVGGAVSIGDQLHPSGQLDAAVYRSIGASFERIAGLEPWLSGSERVVDVAVLAAQRDEGLHDAAQFATGVEAAAQVLLELQIQFDIVDPEHFDTKRYRLIVVPDAYSPPASVRERISEAQANGAKLVLSGASGWDPDTESFLLAGVPARIVGLAPTIPSYIRDPAVTLKDSEFASDYDYVFYDQAYLVEASDDGTALGELKRARHTRSWKHIYGHAQSPVDESLGHPWGVNSDGVLYLAAPLFTAYLKHDYWVYRDLLQAAFDVILPHRAVRYTGPEWVEVTVRHQAEVSEHAERTVIHLTAFAPRRTGNAVVRVDAGASVAAGTVIAVLPTHGVSRAYIAPDGPDLELSGGTELGDPTRVTLPALATHTVVVLEK